jgi:hypothetical protein
MHRLLSLAFLATVLFLSAPLEAQEIELATYNPEQLWARSAWLGVMGSVTAIAFAKSHDVSPQEYGAYLADVYAPGWGQPGTGTLSIARGMSRNFLTDPNCRTEIVEQSQSEITMRVNRCWARYFGEDEEVYGVTLQEYDSVWEAFTTHLAEYLGLGYSLRVEEEFAYLTFTLGG